MKTLYNLKWGMFALIMLSICFLLFSLTSCSSSRKIKQSEYTKSDSSSTSVSQASGTRVVDSSEYKSTEQSYKDEITVNFGDELDIADGEDPVEQAKDLAGPAAEPVANKRKGPQRKSIVEINKKPAPVHSVDIGGQVISSTKPITSIVISKAGKKSVIDLTQFAKKDSGQESKASEVDVNKVEHKKSKDTERHGANVFVWIGIAVALIGGFIVATKLGVFKRKNFESS